MAQKVNPISVRLKLNRKHESHWFSDYYYTDLLFQDIYFKTFFNSVRMNSGNKVGIKRTSKCIIQHYSKKSVFYLFYVGEKNSSLLDTNKATLGSFFKPKTDLLKKKKLEQTINFKSSYKYTKIPTKQFAFLAQTLKHILEENIDSCGLKKFSNGNLSEKKDKIKNEFQFSFLENYSKSFIKKFALEQDFRNDAFFCPFVLAKGLGQKKTIAEKKFTAALKKKQIAVIPSVFESSLAQNQKVWGTKSEKIWLSTAEAITAAVIAVLLPELKQLLLLESNLRTQPFLLNKKAIIYLHFVILLYWAHLKSNCISHLHKYTQSTTLFNIPLVQHLVVNLHSPLFSEASQPNFSHIQSLISHHNHTLTSIIPVQISSIFQCASAVSQDICSKLEQKKTFRQICKSIFQEIRQHPFIKGLRVSCSGRINGAEIAKTEWKQFGETSLHVFSDQIDFAYSKASTVYGVLGIKVWICYRHF